MPSLTETEEVLSIILLSISILLEVFVAYKVRLRLDWSMITISLAFLLSFLFRTIVTPMPLGVSRILQATAALLIQAMLFFFVFEMIKI